MGVAFELVGALFTFLAPLLNMLEIGNAHFPDSIMMFVVIPVVYLLNDEDTKTIIAQEGWYDGIRHMMGITTYVIPQNVGG